MSSDVAIRVQGLSKCYQIYDSPRDRLKQFIMPRVRRILGKAHKQYFNEFWALNDISFEIKRGETVGIIGRNGSGKSTLLQIICGTLTPTSGTVQTTGRIAALLELGSGFNPEFTGRENVYMNGALLGLSQEQVNDKFDDIISFADIGQFIDQPVKTYSSGMVVRLAFAVQSQIDPDILIVDEALSVGDAKFQAKCFERLRQLKENGTSILLVTHSSEQIVTHCTSAILLSHGRQLETGEPRQVINRYLDLLFGKEREVNPAAPPELSGALPSLHPSDTEFELSCTNDIFCTRKGYNPHEYRWGDGTASILDYYLAADNEAYPSGITTGQTVTLVLAIKFHNDLLLPIFGLTIKTKEGVTVYGINSETADSIEFKQFGQKESVVHVKAVFNCRLAAADYFISIGIATRNGEEITPHDRRYDSIHLQIRPNNTFFGLANLEASISAKKVSI